MKNLSTFCIAFLLGFQAVYLAGLKLGFSPGEISLATGMILLAVLIVIYFDLDFEDGQAHPRVTFFGLSAAFSNFGLASSAVVAAVIAGTTSFWPAKDEIPALIAVSIAAFLVFVSLTGSHYAMGRYKFHRPSRVVIIVFAMSLSTCMATSLTGAGLVVGLLGGGLFLLGIGQRWEPLKIVERER